jgi:hypothetical protein
MPDWPTALYGKILKDGYQETPPDNVIRSKPDVGPDKVRRRTTANVTEFVLPMFFTAAELVVFDTFFVSTISYGALSFSYKHPRTQAAGSYRIVGVPKRSKASMGFIVSINMELLP